MTETTREIQTCNRCAQSKSVHAFYLNKQRGRRRTTCIECCKAHPSSNGGKRTPTRRAEYRRERGETAVEYIPRSERDRLIEGRRQAKAHDCVAHVQRWRRAVLKRARVSAALHDSHVALFRSKAVQFRIKYRSDPEFALKQRLRMQIRKKSRLFPKLEDLIRGALKRGGSSRTVADVCGYTIKELKAHLERQFKDGMDWSSFMRGEIHIDHRRPQASFDLASIDGVRQCWALSNLQPLWAADNLKKAARMDWPEVVMKSSGSSAEGAIHMGNARPDLRLATQF